MKGVKEKRLKYEYEELKKFPQFKVNTDPQNYYIWYVSFKGAENTLYAGENFTLQFKFSNEYVRRFFFFFYLAY